MLNNLLLIVGAMKCGTTSLFTYLAQHPEIAPCKTKEPNFFSHDEIWENGLDWYLGLWDWDPSQHKVALEASVNYSKFQAFPHAIQRILSTNFNVKIVYLVRDPIERIESHYTHGLASSNWGTKDRVENGIRLTPHLLEISSYAFQIQKYYDNFPKENILIINFDNLKNNPKQVVETVLRFAELDPKSEFMDVGRIENSNNNRVVNDPLWRGLRKIKILRSASNIIPKSTKSNLHSLFGKKMDSNLRLTDQQKEKCV
jgi:hypothetical protein